MPIRCLKVRIAADLGMDKSWCRTKLYSFILRCHKLLCCSAYSEAN